MTCIHWQVAAELLEICRVENLHSLWLTFVDFAAGNKVEGQELLLVIH
jgi:hypothetical protein